MPDLHNLQTAQLVDMLVEQTGVVTKMVFEKNFGDEYEKQKLLLKAIQSEIEYRKNTADIISTNITTQPDFS